MSRLRAAFDLLRRIVIGFVGTPDYDAYLARHGQIHPGVPPLDRKTFFRARLQARYDGANGSSRCC